jgi:hypothetical protein
VLCYGVEANVRRGETQHVLLVLAAGHVEHPGAGPEAGLDDLGVVGLDGHDRLVGERLHHRHQQPGLLGRRHPLRQGVGGLGPDVEDRGALGDLDPTHPQGRLGRDRHALAVGRVAGQVDRPHERDRPVADDQAVGHLHRRHRPLEVGGVGGVEGGQVGEGDHRATV